MGLFQRLHSTNKAIIEAVGTLGRAKVPLISEERPAPPVPGGNPTPALRIPELVQLFHAINSLNARDQPYILQFIGSVPGEGVSTIAASFVEIAASQRTKQILLIDCNPASGAATQPPSLIDAFHETGSIDAAIRTAADHQRIKLARLSTAEDARLGIDAADLRRLLELAAKSFPVIVLDCPPAIQAPESLALARYCDGTVIVVAAETTARSVIDQTKRALERFDANIIGMVFNQQKNYIPRWLDRRD
ncbi:CpsD/CapB family tyrosine-protein kinase [Methylocapsa palsarum]|uniref:Chromosome partitioning ATPase, Mrp family, contains Fe-S cluster n=1 Tax=Methylocapsa palsarum TaxID=1612308 RepID=A0A1I4C0H8_9HYPH|nr:CpsD/CapB family tyrosine-protein kinase [Methylocapsa palsarum]SFK74584.1 Chromosome partitioning ATPase, Mrp family, contains Fe-S cluster [Methylocapsa palsarum]